MAFNIKREKIVGEFEYNAERIFVKVIELEGGGVYFDIRRYYDQDGEWKPGRKGLMLSVDITYKAELADAIWQAMLGFQDE